MNTPPTIAILGAGPIGLDAALAAFQAGYPFTIYEAGESVGTHIRTWAHVRMFSPWSMNLSTRMEEVLGRGVQSTASTAGTKVAPGFPEDECPTGAAFVSEVLEPLAGMPFVADRLRLGTRVLAVSREGFLKGDEIGTGVRAQRPFRILLRGPNGDESVERADVVLDCTGATLQNPLGDGGIPAPGESSLADRIDHTIPDVDRAPEIWEGRSVLIVGSGHSAQTAAVALSALRDSGTRVLWAIRGEDSSLKPIREDALPERAKLTGRAFRLATVESGVDLLTGCVVEGVRADSGHLRVDLRGEDGSVRTVTADRVLALTGAVGDHAIYRQLQVHECYATSGLMNLSAALLSGASADCLTQTTHGVDTLRSPEPQFFVLGSKSYGSNNTFLVRTGYGQVDEVFEALAETTNEGR